MRGRRLGSLFPIVVVGVVAVLVVPMPTALLDLLLTVNIAFSVLILLASMSIKRPLELSSFPSLLLIATLFRLALSVSTARLILSDGEAGNVIHAFGTVVIGGSIVVGLVVFLILVVIQFVVITAGATRVAEVAARFTLDAMPGKQMAIDADLSAGLIDGPLPGAGAGAPAHQGADLSLVLPVSLLAGGLAAYPSLSAAAEGTGDLMGAVTVFLIATLVATIGFGIVALLFHSFSSSAATKAAGTQSGDQPVRPTGDRTVGPTGDRIVVGGGGGGDDDTEDRAVPTVALAPEHDSRADAIDTALAPTDALLHDR